jgi:hypothetical protein
MPGPRHALKTGVKLCIAISAGGSAGLPSAVQLGFDGFVDACLIRVERNFVAPYAFVCAGEYKVIMKIAQDASLIESVPSRLFSGGKGHEENKNDLQDRHMAPVLIDTWVLRQLDFQRQGGARTPGQDGSGAIGGSRPRCHGDTPSKGGRQGHGGRPHLHITHQAQEQASMTTKLARSKSTTCSRSSGLTGSKDSSCVSQVSPP